MPGLGRNDDCECAMNGVEANGVLGHWAGQLDLLEWQQQAQGEVLLPFSFCFSFFSLLCYEMSRSSTRTTRFAAIRAMAFVRKKFYQSIIAREAYLPFILLVP